ncbi:CoxG family protein [Caenispirillum bisanense]|uniref:Carbon monoxide dehydrogenase subunit G n=1 Tax=Caenispirillum bisanense TaxID=414052 RepID=A0A286GMT3_9PROT|nr:carbon monoxide dehydrogenase subunit G [Caenispirillum bisanense]SOD96838.1 hypothetical protein SAMN05421508_106118 [Caenispirillum bisanense]
MEFSGEYRIPAPRDAVWQALNDVEILKASIDQLETLEWTGATDLRTTVAARVGPVTLRLAASIALSEVEPPHSYVLTGRGEGAGAGFGEAVVRVRLHDEGAATRLAYTCRADVGGPLATMGAGLVRGAADTAAENFFEGFASRLVVAIAARQAAEADAFDLEAELRALAGQDGGEAAAGEGAPFAWRAAGTRLTDRLRELDGLDLLAPAPAPADGWRIPLDARTLVIAGGWALMPVILLLLFAA